MKQINRIQSFLRICMVMVLSISVLSFTANFGLDSYEIYLNNKIILKQTVNQPVSLRVLQLKEANKNDQLRIIYTHCSNKGAGTGRSITLKDEKGNILKKWAFANSAGADLSMYVAVNELLSIEKVNASHELSLYYSAKELPAGEMLSMLNFK
ncbi:MAG: hypothetical protein QM768_22215 [Agriterribacter sp.]